MINNIAILNANIDKPELEPLYPNDGVKYIDFFKPYFTKANYKVFRLLEDEFPENLDDYDLFIITGSLYSTYDERPWINKLEQLIQKLNQQQKKLIGLCFGHQIIAQALGGTVSKSVNGWGLGIKSMEIALSPHLKQTSPSQISLHHIHQDQVDKLPKEAVLLAGDDFCPNHSFSIGNHILTTQGHPEFTNDYVKALLLNIQHNFPKETFQKAMLTLDNKNDGGVFAEIIKQFVEK